MKASKMFRIFQVLVFLVASFFIFSFMYYFPNLPPYARPFVKKGAIAVTPKDADRKEDKRFSEWFNRDPERTAPTEPGLIVAPADGVVTAVRMLDGRKHVVIEMRWTDVHVQRVPLAAQVLRIEGEGKPLPANQIVAEYTLDKMLPFQKATHLRTEIGDVTVRQITSYFAKRIEVFVREGDTVNRGQRLGRILAGSTVVIEMPKDVEVLVKTHQDTIGGETVIAKYKLQSE